MSELVTELRVIDIDNNKNIFDTSKDYIIPLYQRAFAWEDRHLIQLIEDISDMPEGANYYIGTLIIAKQGDKYEVVDGQQRLTSLYLLLNCLGENVQNTLKFACREKSNYTLENIKGLISELRNEKGNILDMDKIEPGIQSGLKILIQELRKQELRKKDSDKERFVKNFIEKLSRVVIYRIEVPEHTDLNRYFEIMNTRGEQLEQHDILKARLMEYLPEESEDDCKNDERTAFTRIWDACSDMTGYVQMHFISKENKVRSNLFASEWKDMPPKDWYKYKSVFEAEEMSEKTSGNKTTILDIIEPNFEIKDDEGFLDDDRRVRFESIIDFSYFLLHTLKVLIKIKNIEHEDGKSAIIAEILDDKRLVDSFTKVIEYGCMSGTKISDNKAGFSRDFIVCLLRSRYLFDKYIIKREYANEDSVGEWSLKSLDGSEKKPYYRNTEFRKSGEWTKTTYAPRTRSNIMIQSALRVSYISPKVMHWITSLLIWLSEDDCKNTENDNIVRYTDAIENIAKEAVRKNFFEVCNEGKDICNEDEYVYTKGKYAMGVNTPHIVFNYLDYLIWDADRKKDAKDADRKNYDDFTFEFRNSVEHWYPRYSSEGTFDPWKDGDPDGSVDSFGNLCLIQRNINARFSNMSPEAKRSTFKDIIAKGSLKLREMAELTEEHGSSCWKEKAHKKHEEEMIKLLQKACCYENQDIN